MKNAVAARGREAVGCWLFENCNANRVWGDSEEGSLATGAFEETDNCMESLILAQDERWRRA